MVVQSASFDGVIANDTFSIEDRQVQFNYTASLYPELRHRPCESGAILDLRKRLTAAVDCAGLSQDLDAASVGWVSVGSKRQLRTSVSVPVMRRGRLCRPSTPSGGVEIRALTGGSLNDQGGNADELGNPQTSPGTISDGGFEWYLI